MLLDTYRVESETLSRRVQGSVWRVHHTGWNVRPGH